MRAFSARTSCEALLAGITTCPLRRQPVQRGARTTSPISPVIRGFEFMRHDVTFPLCVEVEAIFNLACSASPVPYQFDPVSDHQDERSHGATQLCWASPSGCGAPHPASVSPARSTAIRKVHPQREDYLGRVNLDSGVRSRYDEGKRRGLKRCPSTTTVSIGVAIKVARIFISMYGPRMHPQS